MENTDRSAAGKMALPLAQTVFLPKTAMGVRYIEKIRTTVYAERVIQQDRERWLRGFYELDMEYRGLEGKRLYKHRVMLPLKVELPRGWLGGRGCDVADMHIVIGTPAIQILSPYVLEFSGQLWLEYIGSGAMPEDMQQDPARQPGVRRWRSDIPPVVQDEAAKRLESKIDRMFFHEFGEAGADRDMMRPRRAEQGAAAAGNTDTEEGDFRLPVWRRGDKAVRTAARRGMERRESIAAAGQTDGGFSEEQQSAARLQLRNKIRSIFTRLQPEDIAEIFRQEIVMQARPQLPDDTAEEVLDTNSGFHLPVWRKQNTVAAEIASDAASSSGVASLRDKVLGRMQKDNEYASAGVFKTGRPAVPGKLAEKLPAQESSKSKLRSMLTAAAIARLQTQGEKLLAVDVAAEPVSAEPMSVAEPVALAKEEKPAGTVSRETPAVSPVSVPVVDKVQSADEAEAVKVVEVVEVVEPIDPVPVIEVVARGEEPQVNEVAVPQENTAKEAAVVLEDAGAEKAVTEEVKVEVVTDTTLETERKTATRILEEALAAAVANMRHSLKVEAREQPPMPVQDVAEEIRDIPVIAEERAAGKAEEVIVVNADAEEINVEDAKVQNAKVENTKMENVKAENAQVEEVTVQEVGEASLEDNAAPVAVAGGIGAEEAVAEETVVEAAAVESPADEAVVAEEMAALVQEMAVDAPVEVLAGQSQAESGAGQVRLVNTNGVRLRMNTGARQNMELPRSTAKTSGCSLKYYVVKPGDDPMGIALKHNVSLESLRADNKLLDGELTAGMVLRIPC